MKNFHVLLLLLLLFEVARGSDCEVSSPCTLDFESIYPNEGTNIFLKTTPTSPNYATFHLEAADASEVITVSWTMLYGLVDVYITGDGSQPSKTNFQWSSTHSNMREMITMTPEEIGDLADDGKDFNILITSKQTAKGRILVSKMSSVVGLTLGLPQLGQHAAIRQGGESLEVQSTRYSFATSDLTEGAPLTVALTQLSGIGAALRLTNGDQEWNAHPDSNGESYVYVEDFEAQDNFGLIEVLCNNASVFVVVVTQATENNPTWLLGGLAVVDYAAAGTNRFYMAEVPASDQELAVSLEPLQGNPDLYLSKSHFFKPGGNVIGEVGLTASTGDNAFELVTASAGGLLKENGGEYYITAHMVADTLYAAKLTAASSLSILRENRPTHAKVLQGRYEYFQFYDAEPTASRNLVITVTSISGDSDLYVGCKVNNTGNELGYPSKLYQHFNFSSANFWEDYVDISHTDPKSCATVGHPGSFYVAVYGYDASEFTITATKIGGVVTLHPGVPQLGTVYPLQSAEYRFRVGATSSPITITVTPEYGDPDILVASNGEEVSWVNYQYASLNTGQDTDQVTIPSDVVCTNCWITVKVISLYGEARFSIVAQTEEGATVLSNGWPHQLSLNKDQYKYYSFTAANDGVLVVTLTTLSGAATLLVSSEVNRPTLEMNGTIAIASGDVTSSVTPQVYINDVLAQQEFSVGIVGLQDDTTCTVQAHVDRGEGYVVLNHMIDGVPQDDTLSQGETHYYQIVAPRGHGLTTIIATPTIGDIDMYVRRCNSDTSRCNNPNHLPSPTNFTWSSTGHASKESVEFEHLDHEGCSYIIAVKALTAADFAVTCYFEGSILRLVPGKAISDHVNDDSSLYYKVEVPNFNKTLTIALTTITGDADLYVSTTITHPNPSNYSWYMSKIGDDTLSLSPDQVSCKDCVFFIGVYGWSESTFSIVAKFAETTVMMLTAGQPQTDAITFGQFAYYSFRVAAYSDADFKITLTPSYGDADLFVTLDGSDPTYANCDYCSENWMIADSVTIRHTDELFIESCAASGCTVRVAVYGYSASEYTLLLKELKSSSVLQENVAHQSTLAQGAFEYFEFTWQEPLLQLQLTPFSGHPTLFVSCEAHFPNATTSQWALDVTNTGNPATLHIHTNETEAITCLPLPSTIYLSVYGNSMVTYSLLASQSGKSAAESITRLQYGMQQSGSVQYQEFKFYKVRTSLSDTLLELSSNIMSGNINLYVSRLDEARPALSSDGTVENWVMRSVTNSNEHIEIPYGGIGLCSDIDAASCYFLLAVYGAQNSPTASEYTLLATTNSQMDLMQDGVPIHGHTEQHQYSYYGYSVVQRETDLVVYLTPFSGDPDIYISPSPHHPTTSNYTWRSSWYGGEQLSLQAAELNAVCTPDPDAGKTCDYIFGIYGFTNTTYTLMALASEGWANPISLVMGQPQTGAVEDDEFVYYQIHLTQNGAETPNVVVTVTSMDDGDQDLFITFSDTSEPGPDTAVIQSVSWSGSEVVRLTPGMPDYCMDCTMYIGVFGYIGGTYSIVVSTGLQSLQAGTPQHGTTSNDDFLYYSFNNHGTGSVTVDLTVITGDADLFIGTDVALPEAQLPDFTNYIWSAFSQGSDSVTILSSDANYCTECTYLVGVYGFSNSTFTITASLGGNFEVILLTHNRPQVGSVTQGNSKYFYISLGNTNEDLVVSLTALTGSANLYVKEGSQTDVPSPDDYDYTTVGMASDHLVIKGPHEDLSSYMIAVTASQDTDFVLVATFSQHPQLLQSGGSIRAEVAAGELAYYEFLLDKDADVQVSCVAISGDPDILVSTHSLPTCEMVDSMSGMTACGNFTWGSFEYSTDTMTISHTTPCEATNPNMMIIPSCKASDFKQGPFYIGVYSQDGSSFTISASSSGGVTSLVDGLPQHGMTSVEVLCENIDEDTGGCNDATTIKAHMAHFRFKVSTHDLNSQGHVAITLVPDCKESEEDSQVITQGPGCSAKDPLMLAVRSCKSGTCTRGDQRPIDKKGRYHAKRTVDSNHGTLFIANDPLDSNNGFCDPSDGETCFYYISVIHYNISVPAAFTLTASTPGDVGVIPCPDPLPRDGIMMSPIEVVYSAQKNYEACAKESKGTTISLETCSGDLTLMICQEDCDSVYPSPNNFFRKSNFTHTCSMSKVANSQGKVVHVENCDENIKGYPWVDIATATDSTFFIGVTGSGTYKLKIQTETEKEEELPFLTTNDDPVVTADSLTEESVSISWPSTYAVWKEASRLEPDGLFYTVYLFDFEGREGLNKACWTKKCGLEDLIASTSCGLQHYATSHSEASTTYTVDSFGFNNEVQTFQLSGLKPSTTYGISVLSKCNSDCMRGLSNSHCYGKLCQETALPYDILYIKTASDFETQSMWSMVKVATGALLLVVFGVFIAFVVYRRKRSLQQRPQWNLQDADDSIQLTLSSAPADFMRRRFREGVAGSQIPDIASKPLMASGDDSDEEGV